MKRYIYDFTAEGMQVSSSQANRIGLCCYDDESASMTKAYEYLDHTDLSLFGRELSNGSAPFPIPFFADASDANATRSIAFSDLLRSGDDMLDLYEDMDRF